MRSQPLSRTNGFHLDDVDRQLLDYLSRYDAPLRLSELVNENRDHDLDAAEVECRLERLQALGLVRPAYWEVAPGAVPQTPPRFRLAEVRGKPQTAEAALSEG